MSVRLQPLIPAHYARNFELAPHIALLKLRIVALLVVVSLSTAALSAKGAVKIDQMILLALAGALASAGAAALNHYFERDIDGRMKRTGRRPLPGGRVSPRSALVVGLCLIGAGLGPAIFLGMATTVFVLAGAFCYVFVYTLCLKRRTHWSVPVGGIAGSCAALAGWFSVGEVAISATPLLIALILFFWNQSHFWSFAIAEEADYRLVGVPMLPIVVGRRVASQLILANTIALVTTTLALYVAAPLGLIYLYSALIAGVILIAHNLRLVRTPTRLVGWSNFKFSGFYLLALFLAIVVDASL